ncbi:MAG: DUF1439 domain-containing protein [Pseudomonadota bacterium]
MMNRKLLLCIFTVVSSISVLAGCDFHDRVVEAVIPQHIFYTRTDIQKRIAERWNVDKKSLGFAIKIDSPQIELVPDTNRLKCSFKLSIRPPLSSHELRGSLVVSGALRFDAPSRKIYLVNTEIIAINSEGSPFEAPIVQLISGLFGGTLTDIKLYELKPEDLRFAGVMFDPIGFTVQEKGIEVQLEPHAKAS